MRNDAQARAGAGRAPSAPIMTAEARLRILSQLPAQESPAPIVAPHALPRLDAGERAELVERFSAAAEARGVGLTRERGVGATRLAVFSHLRSAEARQLLIWDEAHLPLPGLLDALQMLGIEAITPQAEGVRSRALLRQDKPPAFGLTTALAGIAAEGGVIVRYPSAQHMLTACWPPRHLVLLPTSRLVASCEAWMRQASEDWRGSDWSLALGPSLSWEIEQTPVTGATGPAQMHIFLIEENWMP